jgi:hypothetical protein
VALDELAADLIDREARGDTPYGLYIMRADDEASELARAVEREVFLEFFGNTAELLAEEYDPFERASLFLCVVDHLRKKPAAALRLLLPSPAGHKSLLDLERAWGQPPDDVIARSGLALTFDQAELWDVATLAVSADYRGASSAGLVSLGLYQGLTMLAGAVDLAHAIAIFDLIVLDLVQSNFHRPWTPFTGVEPQRYLDSPSSLPVYCDVREYRARLALIDADMYELLFAGAGLEAVISSPLRGVETDLDVRWFQTA